VPLEQFQCRNEDWRLNRQPKGPRVAAVGRNPGTVGDSRGLGLFRGFKADELDPCNGLLAACTEANRKMKAPSNRLTAD